MNLRDTALRAYYYASLPYRRLRWPAEAAPVCVLFYHRISDRGENPWTMSTAMFEEQMDYLQEHCELVTLERAQRIIGGEVSCQRPAVCVTFDDGYGDNVDFALPLIIDRNIPCTYFVSYNHVIHGQPFPHDAALDRPLPPNNLAELRDMSEAGIEIGGHTRTHLDLVKVTDEGRLYDEVVTAGIELAAAIGQRIRYFAFPYGLHANLHPAAFAMAESAGYEAVCSAYGGYNFRGDDAFHIQRFHADPCLLRLKNWLSVDPRKLCMAGRYEFRQRPDYLAWHYRSAALAGHRPPVPAPSRPIVSMPIPAAPPHAGEFI